jgi:hypothetical protein
MVSMVRSAVSYSKACRNRIAVRMTQRQRHRDGVRVRPYYTSRKIDLSIEECTILNTISHWWSITVSMWSSHSTNPSRGLGMIHHDYQEK